VLGASAVTLLHVGDYFGLRHSLHRRWREARTFHRTYAACVLAAAAVVLIPQVPLGLLTTAVQALAGVLLPSATVFLLLLCNDREVLGPLVNPRWLNVLAATVIGALLGLSVLLTATTIVPRCYLLAAIIVLAVRAIQVALGAG
jgi:Mn2+/Fe2+ NRAMP family transporter